MGASTMIVGSSNRRREGPYIAVTGRLGCIFFAFDTPFLLIFKYCFGWGLGMLLKPRDVVFRAAERATARRNINLFFNAIEENINYLDQTTTVGAYNYFISCLLKAESRDCGKALMFMRGVCGSAAPDVVTFNMLLAKRLKASSSSRLSRLKWTLEEMQGEGVAPDEVTFNTALASFNSISIWAEYEGIMACMDSCGVKPTMDTFKSLMHSMKGGNGKGASAKDYHIVVGLMRKAGVQANVAAVTFEIGSRPTGELENFDECMSRLRKQGIEPDRQLLHQYLKRLCDEQKLKYCLAFPQQMEDLGFAPDVVTYNMLLKVLSDRCRNTEVGKLWKEMRARGVQPDLFSYNTVLHGLSGQSRFNECFELVEHMEASGIKPDVVTFNTLITGLAREEDVTRCEEVLARMRGVGIRPDRITYNLFLSMFAKTGEFESYVLLVDEMFSVARLKPDLLSMKSLQNVLEKRSGELDKFWATLRRFRGTRVLRNSTVHRILHNKLLEALGAQGRLDEISEVVGEMLGDSLTPDDVTLRPIIAQLLKQGRLDVCRQLMEDISRRAGSGGALDTLAPTYDVLLKGLLEKGKVAGVHQILEDMREGGVLPSHTTFGTLLRGFAKQGEVGSILEVRAQMEARGLAPTPSMLAGMVQGLAGACRIGPCMDVLGEMQEAGLKLPAKATFVLVRGLIGGGRVDEAMEVLRVMHGSGGAGTCTGVASTGGGGVDTPGVEELSGGAGEATIDHFNSLLDGLLQKGCVDECIVVLDLMRRAGVQPNIVTLNSLVTEFTRMGKLEESMGVLQTLGETGVSPDSETFSGLMNGVATNREIDDCFLGGLNSSVAASNLRMV